MDGRHAFLTRKLCEVSAEMSLNVLQPEAGHKNPRYQRFNESAVGLKRPAFWPHSKVKAALGLPSPSDDPQDMCELRS